MLAHLVAFQAMLFADASALFSVLRLNALAVRAGIFVVINLTMLGRIFRGIRVIWIDFRHGAYSTRLRISSRHNPILQP